MLYRPAAPVVQHPTSPLIHLFRALLRETTYLPDADARLFCRQQIITRFKAYQPDTKSLPVWQTGLTPYKRRWPDTIKRRAAKKQKEARKALTFLRRANNGDMSCLERVLLHTYGRIGRRRHKLLERLLEPEVAADSMTVEAMLKANAASLKPPLQQIYHSGRGALRYFAAPRRTSETEVEYEISDKYPKLKAVIKSQQSTTAHNPVRSVLKASKVVAPSKNIWGRPMPIKRARNIVSRWYKSTVEKILPPLPDYEWDRLCGLAAGDIKWEGLIPRRPVGIDRSQTHKFGDSYLTLLASAVPSPATSDTLNATSRDTILQTSKMKILRDGLTLRTPSFADVPRGKDRPHNITPRFMRRLYAKVSAQCCKLTCDPIRQTWQVEWGSFMKLNPRPLSYPINNQLFEGVNGEGKRLKPSAAS
ncbi:hypothetical protein AOQ84DRAFT_217272 [Glonium stellatum]|uniref:LYR motif-containing protein Cup1-like N-terminal domain-containing protein n=1 Tax=Glonium stellatum TaxID=574774 RepID=A0A8E2ENA4_9PEZI|nr:hypothetical protein AOQ84DRAFT_217272 [Glonium stellatum]